MADTAVENKPVELTLGDGTVVKGATYEEALQNLGKMKVDTANALKAEKEAKQRLEEELTRYKQTEEEHRAEAERQAAAARQKNRTSDDGKGFDKEHYYRLLNDDPIAAANYLDAIRLGVEDPDQVPQRFNSMAAQISEINQERIASAFWRQHPEFPHELTAARSLDKRVSQLLGEGHPFNVRTFNMAYEELLAEDTIKPMEIEDDKQNQGQQQTEENRPNPSLSGGGATSAEDAELKKMENMDEKQLEAYGREKGWIR